MNRSFPVNKKEKGALCVCVVGNRPKRWTILDPGSWRLEYFCPQKSRKDSKQGVVHSDLHCPQVTQSLCLSSSPVGTGSWDFLPSQGCFSSLLLTWCHNHWWEKRIVACKIKYPLAFSCSASFPEASGRNLPDSLYVCVRMQMCQSKHFFF